MDKRNQMQENMMGKEEKNLNTADTLEATVLSSLYQFIESKNKSDDVTSRLLLNLYQDVSEIKKALGAGEKQNPISSISNDMNQPQAQPDKYEQLLEALSEGRGK